jgi:hypothetical protein
MNKSILAWAVMSMSVACGDDGSETSSSAGFLQGPLPSEPTLCRLEMGVATVADAGTVLGAPTNTTSFSDETTLGYYWGSVVNPRATLVLTFDADGRLHSASLQDIVYPQCWRDQLKAGEASESTEVGSADAR